MILMTKTHASHQGWHAVNRVDPLEEDIHRLHEVMHEWCEATFGPPRSSDNPNGPWQGAVLIINNWISYKIAFTRAYSVKFEFKDEKDLALFYLRFSDRL